MITIFTITISPKVCSLPWDDRHPERVLKRTGKGLTFVTESGVQVLPLYDVHRQRYVVYWDCMEQ